MSKATPDYAGDALEWIAVAMLTVVKSPLWLVGFVGHKFFVRGGRDGRN